MLTNLEHLDMSYSGEYTMGGLIPSEIGKLRNLTWMDFRGNAFTGAGNGICDILKKFFQNCDFLPNPSWTDGTLCPVCLNTFQCKPPVTCTGPN
jgi:hypothetical protein